MTASTPPRVALESTIFSHLGLPSPANREALDRCVAAVRAGGAEPALTAVIDGEPTVGVDLELGDRICGPAHKVAARDLAVAAAQGWDYGATTVSASVTLAASAGIEVFATGGIGGVHRGWADTGDISADLGAIARWPVVTVSAGAKIFLDLAATLERLETDSVPVLGWRCDEFPAFHARSSGLPVPHRVETAAEVAAIARAHWRLGGGGILVVAPVPEAHALAPEPLAAAVETALVAADDAGVTGPAVTPAVLAALAAATDGDSVPTNLALAEHNASVAAEIAVALASG
ncbi:MAG: pseudouridine-5'-phosphate glycosidase [Acidimicrobiales bacterium]